MGAAILKLDRDRKLLNADFPWVYPDDLKPVEPIQKHVDKCEQRITSYMIYNDINLSQKEPYKRKMLKNDSDINAQNKL